MSINGTLVPMTNTMEGRGTPTHILLCFPEEHFLDLGKGYYQIKNIDKDYDKHHSKQVKLKIGKVYITVPNLLYKNKD